MGLQEENHLYGKVEAYNSRLVAKVYSKKNWFQYQEIFLLVAMLKSIKVLLSITMHLHYDILKMDVMTTFLNDYLNESICMM